YTLTITKQGFATVLQQNVNLTVGQTINIPVTLKVSAVAQQIVVSEVPIVEVTKTESASTLDELSVATTPVLGRKFEDLLTLTPGVSIVQGPDGDEINVNGQRGIFNNVSLDGGDYNNGFFVGAGEGILENLTRTNLSVPLGTACAISNPVFNSNITDAQIATSPDCQRQVLLNFMKSNFNEDDSLPVIHQVRNASIFGRVDYNLNAKNQIFGSYNFDWSKNPNQTFDVPTYGSTANGVEGPSKIQAISTNWVDTLSNNLLNEAHFTYARENRPRGAIDRSSVPDTAMGFSPTFRFGQPFFLEPTIDELFYRTDIRDNFSIIRGAHTWKFGGEWIHSRNDQIFRGFFTGRYIFSSV